MSYRDIDSVIGDWIRRHGLHLLTGVAGNSTEIRAVYISSEANEVFQIWVDEPVGGRVTVYAACIEGPGDEDPPQRWTVETRHLDTALDDVFKVVLDWMLPSKRFIPRVSAV